MLMPAAVLVVMVLGAIAVDQSIVYTQQRELVAAAEAAANDAAGYGLDREAFYERNELVFDLARARAAALAALRARRIDGAAVVSLSPGGTEVLGRASERRSSTSSPARSRERPERRRCGREASAELRRR